MPTCQGRAQDIADETITLKTTPAEKCHCSLTSWRRTVTFSAFAEPRGSLLRVCLTIDSDTGGFKKTKCVVGRQSKGHTECILFICIRVQISRDGSPELHLTSECRTEVVAILVTINSVVYVYWKLHIVFETYMVHDLPCMTACDGLVTVATKISREKNTSCNYAQHQSILNIKK